MIKTNFMAIAAVAFLAPSTLFAEGPASVLSETEQHILRAVDDNYDASLAFLEVVVNENSGTMNHDGVRAVGDHFTQAFEEAGFSDTNWINQDDVNRAGHLVVERKGDLGPRLLLIGHLDTIFPKNSPYQTFRLDGDKAWGPGVVDMKGGDVVVLYALKALEDLDLIDSAQIKIIFTGDEEMTGKPIKKSRKDLIKAAKWADIALNFEGGRSGIAVSSRRGASGWKLTVTGQRRHSSGIFSESTGAGAVFEAARILNAFYEELREEKYLTFNPGVIVGGTDVQYDESATRGDAFGKTNVVAQKVVVHGGLRFISEEQKANARTRMREIAASHLPHTSAALEFTDSYPAMSPSDNNQQLLEIFSDASEALGYGAVVGNDPAKRGAADVSFAAPYVGASMDGLGVSGSGSHTPEEYMELESFKDATRRAAILIYRITREDAPNFR